MAQFDTLIWPVQTFNYTLDAMGRPTSLADSWNDHRTPTTYARRSRQHVLYFAAVRRSSIKSFQMMKLIAAKVMIRTPISRSVHARKSWSSLEVEIEELGDFVHIQERINGQRSGQR